MMMMMIPNAVNQKGVVPVRGVRRKYIHVIHACYYRCLLTAKVDLGATVDFALDHH